MEFIRDVLSGCKFVLRFSELMNLKVPRFREFSMAKLLEICKDGELVLAHLPDMTIMARPLERKFAYNLSNSLRGEYFR